MSMSENRPGHHEGAVSADPGDGFLTREAGSPDREGESLVSSEPVHLSALLAASASRHSHLCPRQVLGVRVGLAGLAYLELPAHAGDKRVLIISETDGCFLDGLEVASGATPGHRTLRIEDYGKAGATFVDTLTGRAVRVAPHPDSRLRARQYTPPAAPGKAESEFDSWTNQRYAYQVMPDQELLILQPVRLVRSLEEIISRPGLRATCAVCAEEIINERQVEREGRVFCRTCAGPGYYQPLSNDS